MMTESVEFYQKQARANMSKQPWLLNLQETARQDLIQTGFPTRHDEDWKYTSVDSFLKHRFVHNKAQAIHTNSFESPIPCHKLSIVDGFLAHTPTLPDGVLVLPLIEALAVMPEKVTAHLGQILKSEHAFHALNMAMLSQGLFIYIPKNVCVSEPLWIQHWQTQSNQAVHVRHLLVAESGSQVSVIEDYSGVAERCYYTNTITEIHLDQSAHVTHYKIQRESKHAYHVGHVAVRQATDSQFDSHFFSTGGQWMRSDLTINLDEPHARCSMNGMYIPYDGQHMDHHTLVNHRMPDCQSAQDYRGILKGRSRAVFNGRVLVAKDAQRTVAKQQNKNLLLSGNAEIDTKPQLDIFADDVVCTHGATVGQLDEEALFYLATRGLEYEEASRFLMQAFMTENLRAIPNESLAAWLGDLFIEQIG